MTNFVGLSETGAWARPPQASIKPERGVVSLPQLPACCRKQLEPRRLLVLTGLPSREHVRLAMQTKSAKATSYFCQPSVFGGAPSKASSLQRNLARIDRTATKTLERHRTHCVAGTLKKVLGGTGRAASKPITRRRTAWRALPASKIPASIGRPKPTGLGRN